jgi:hypothetical protein
MTLRGCRHGRHVCLEGIELDQQGRGTDRREWIAYAGDGRDPDLRHTGHFRLLVDIFSKVYIVFNILN